MIDRFYLLTLHIIYNGKNPKKNIMEEKIYQRLKKQLKNSSLTERTIRSKAKRLASKITSEDDLTEDMIVDAVGDLEELNGQLNKILADKKEELEKQVGTRLKTQDSPVDSPSKKEDLSDDFFASFQDRINAIENKINETLKEQRASSIKDAAKSILKSKNANKDYILKNVLNRVKIDDSDTPETLADKCIPLYDAEYKEAYGEGSTPRSSDSGAEADLEAARARLLAFKEKKKISS
jgi:hypothetical protein